MSWYEAKITLRVMEPSDSGGTVGVTYEALPHRFYSDQSDLALISSQALAVILAPPTSPLFAAGHHWLPTGTGTVAIVPISNVVSYYVDIEIVDDPQTPAEQ